LSAFFFYVVNILAFVNQPPWHIKAVIIAVFSIPAAVFLLLGAFFRGFSHTQRDTGIVLLSASALSALAMLSFFCAWASPDIARYFSAGTFRFFSDTVSGIVCLSLYVLIGFGLLFIRRQSA
jgi:hypothetical protein